MIRVKEISTLVASVFLNERLEKFDGTLKTWGVWEEKLVLVGGVRFYSMVGPAELWVKPLAKPSLSLLRAFRPLVVEAKRRYPWLYAQVDSSSPNDQRFAEWCGFRLVGPRADDPAWLIYEA